MEILELKITPIKHSIHASGKVTAICKATFEGGLVLKNIRIKEGKKGIFVSYPANVEFTDLESRKKIDNRILATYVINHCIDDYETPDSESKVA